MNKKVAATAGHLEVVLSYPSPYNILLNAARTGANITITRNEYE